MSLMKDTDVVIHDMRSEPGLINPRVEWTTGSSTSLTLVSQNIDEIVIFRKHDDSSSFAVQTPSAHHLSGQHPLVYHGSYGPLGE